MSTRKPEHLTYRASLAGAASALALVVCAASTVHAESPAHALSNPRSQASALSRPSPAAPRNAAAPSSRASAQQSPPSHVDEGEDEASLDPMSPVSLGVHLGVAGTQAGSGTVQGYEGRTDRRVGLHVSVPLYLGGSGFGWVIEPMLQRSEVQRATKDLLGNVTGREGVSVLGLGGYTGPLVQIHASRAFYLGIGLGVKVLYLTNDAFDYALDLYGRLPVSGTYYVNDHLALMVELGLGYGVTVFADEPTPVVSEESNTLLVRNASDDPEFGAAFAWDLSFGVRLP